MNLAELKSKYGLGDGAKYEPKSACSFCGGSGERVDRRGTQRFCICLFVDHEISDFAGRSLADVARKLSDEAGKQ